MRGSSCAKHAIAFYEIVWIQQGSGLRIADNSFGVFCKQSPPQDEANARAGCPGAESNHRHADFQSAALPTELPGPAPACNSCARTAGDIYEVERVFNPFCLAGKKSGHMQSHPSLSDNRMRPRRFGGLGTCLAPQCGTPQCARQCVDSSGSTRSSTIMQNGMQLSGTICSGLR